MPIIRCNNCRAKIKQHTPFPNYCSTRCYYSVTYKVDVSKISGDLVTHLLDNVVVMSTIPRKTWAYISFYNPENMDSYICETIHPGKIPDAIKIPVPEKYFEAVKKIAIGSNIEENGKCECAVPCAPMPVDLVEMLNSETGLSFIIYMFDGNSAVAICCELFDEHPFHDKPMGLRTINNTKWKCRGRRCYICYNETSLVCGKCRLAVYCSVKCQREGYEFHSKRCNEDPSAREQMKNLRRLMRKTNGSTPVAHRSSQSQYISGVILDVSKNISTKLETPPMDIVTIWPDCKPIVRKILEHGEIPVLLMAGTKILCIRAADYI